jgi:NAD(P)H dehydrogenase (quinone)
MNVAVIFYSLYGSTATLAAAVAEGAEQAGAAVRLRQVPELVLEGGDPWRGWTSDRIRAQKERLASVPLAEEGDLLWADGVAFGSPARYGNMCAQLGRFLDGGHRPWLTGELAGKVAGVFCPASAARGAQESTLLSMMGTLFHLGFLIHGLPRARAGQRSTAPVDDGAACGAPYAGGLGPDHLPTELDRAAARALGRHVAVAAGRLRG